MAVPNIISGNLTASITDHLTQFLVAPNIFLTVLLKPPTTDQPATDPPTTSTCPPTHQPLIHRPTDRLSLT